MSKELISRLYSTEADVRREAVYRILFDRRHDLVHELKQAAFYEQNEEIALLIAQVAMTLEAFPRDHSLERQILEYLTQDGGINDMPKKMWVYLSTHGSSEMLIAAMGAMGETIPPKGQDFIEGCLNHADPEIRAMACGIAINSGRPTHFAYVLNLITDPDPMVSEAAFRVVKELPSDQMSIILDYAMGSPDEWVLQNVAPFLPLLITNDLRKVIAKVQYHSHPLVAKKAREALKQLDSIPFVSKRLREKHAAEETDQATGSDNGKDAEEKLSFKEQMEEKRRKRMEEEEKKKAENERIEAELAQTSDDELDELSGALEEFEQETNGVTSDDSEPVPEVDEALVENLDFENELAVLEDVDENVDLDQVAMELEQTEVAQEADLPAVGDEDAVIDLSQAQQELINDEAEALPHEQELRKPEVSKAVEEHQSAEGGSVEEPEENSEQKEFDEIKVEIADEIDDDIAEIEAEPVEISIEDSDNEISEEGIDDIVVEEVEIEVEEHVDAISSQAAEPARQAVVPAAARTPEEPIPEGAIKIPVIPAAQTILTRYPSFLTETFANLFKPARPEIHLKNIALVADNLIAYLNLCFLQSCLFFAPPSDVLARSVKECLKGHLTGPTALRCLHNFALAMKQSRENPVFFTFSLANILTESSETNPVMMLRELKEYLKQPIEPLEETLPQAIEGVAEILRGVKAILNNLIVMRAPKGAKEPFADLSGPLAKVLPADRRPGIELPAGEAVVLSRDGSEALGLFPYFKYSRRKVFFSRPDPNEFKVLLERLEIEL